MERDRSARSFSGEIEADAVLMNRLIVPQFRTEPAHITTESTAAALIVLPLLPECGSSSYSDATKRNIEEICTRSNGSFGSFEPLPHCQQGCTGDGELLQLIVVRDGPWP
ncbi:hypothetical protein ACVIGB_003886 [Bradyrhizobium sp. USDA 4341]